MNYIDDYKTEYKDHKVLDNENIEVVYCDVCKRYTLHKEVYGTDQQGNLKELLTHKCLRCDN